MARLKPLSEQTIVITGASSGIGLATARRAAGQGAKVVLVARNKEALDEAVHSIEVRGGKAAAFAIDIADAGAPEKIGAFAIDTFGGFDTWVNDAAVALYARLDETTSEEMRRVFDVGYFALVESSLYAARAMRHRGGALINIGSVLSERAVPLQGAYSAMKHAVRGFTDALRMELEMDGSPVSVTLIKPNGINTPYPEHARNKMSKPSRIPPVVYDPELVAKAICFAAENRKREMTVGGQGYMLTTLGHATPRAMDLVMENFFGESAQTIDTPAREGADDNLFEPRRDGHERSNQDIYVRKYSLTLAAQMMSPWTMLAVAGGIAAGAAAIAASALGQRRPGSIDRNPYAYRDEDQLDPAPYQPELEAGIADENAIPSEVVIEELVVVQTDERRP